MTTLLVAHRTARYHHDRFVCVWDLQYALHRCLSHRILFIFGDGSRRGCLGLKATILHRVHRRFTKGERG